MALCQTVYCLVLCSQWTLSSPSLTWTRYQLHKLHAVMFRCLWHDACNEEHNMILSNFVFIIISVNMSLSLQQDTVCRRCTVCHTRWHVYCVCTGWQCKVAGVFGERRTCIWLVWRCDTRLTECWLDDDCVSTSEQRDIYQPTQQHVHVQCLLSFLILLTLLCLCY